MSNERNKKVTELIQKIEALVYENKNEVPPFEAANIIVALGTATGRAVGYFSAACGDSEPALNELSEFAFGQMKVAAKNHHDKIKRLDNAAGEMADELRAKRQEK